MCVCNYYRNIYKSGSLPKGAQFVGYARSELTIAQIRERAKPFMKVSADFQGILQHLIVRAIF